MKLTRNKVNPRKLIEEKKSLADRIEEEFEEKGVLSFVPNDGLNIDHNYLEMPRNITEVSNKDLGEYLNAFTQQNMYMKTLLGWAECYLEDARKVYIENSAAKYREFLNTKLTETAKEREVNSDADIKPYYDDYMEARLKINLLKSNIESIDNAIFTISREISRRNGDFETERRNYNVQGR